MVFDNRKYQSDYYQANKEKKIKAASERQIKHRDTVNRCHKRLYTKRRLKIIELLGGKCSNPNCLVVGGCKDVRCLQFDHINGGGSEQRRHLGSVSLLKYILEHLDEFQLFCANCNWIKRFENEEHGQREVKGKDLNT